jgi:septum formation protein
MNQNKFWLASNSPRRREIATWAGWQLEKVSPDVDESMLEKETAERYVKRIAELKSGIRLEKASADDFVISADTIVALDGKILGKPRDAQHAFEMLVSLRARDHWVMTAIAVRRADEEKTRVELCKSQVRMRAYSDQEIARYIESGDPIDKAGAYAIQNQEFHPAEKFCGCMASVMGIPLCHLERSLRHNPNYDWTDWPSVCQKKLEYKCSITNRVMAGEDVG